MNIHLCIYYCESTFFHLFLAYYINHAHTCLPMYTFFHNARVSFYIDNFSWGKNLNFPSIISRLFCAFHCSNNSSFSLKRNHPAYYISTRMRTRTYFHSARASTSTISRKIKLESSLDSHARSSEAQRGVHGSAPSNEYISISVSRAPFESSASRNMKCHLLEHIAQCIQASRSIENPHV